MAPRDVLLNRLTEHYVPTLEAQGFRFSASGIHLTRTVGKVRQLIDFQSSRWNAGNDCQFWTLWSARSGEYRKWHQQEWGAPPDSDWLGGCADWNIPGWSRGAGVHFHLSNSTHDSSEMQALLENTLKVGLPYLTLVSTWEGAAQELLRWRWHHDLAGDFFLIAGKRDLAREALEAGIRAVEVDGRADPFREIPRIRARLERYFASSASAG